METTTERLQVDDLLIDTATGEILEWTGGPRELLERAALLICYHLEAKTQESAWAQAKRAYAAVLCRMADELGESRIATSAGIATRVADGTMRSAPAASLQAAVEAELLTGAEAAELAIAAVKELDVAAVERWLERLPTERCRALRPVLIIERPRSGYATTAPARRLAPQTGTGRSG